MNKRTRALAIPKAVKDAVWARDGCCVWCGSPYGQPNAHYIARSQSGLGIEENILTLCIECHQRYDQSGERKIMREYFTGYLRDAYPGWDEKNLTYKRDIG